MYFFLFFPDPISANDDREKDPRSCFARLRTIVMKLYEAVKWPKMYKELCFLLFRRSRYDFIG